MPCSSEDKHQCFGETCFLQNSNKDLGGGIQLFFIADFFRVLLRFKIKINGIVDR